MRPCIAVCRLLLSGCATQAPQRPGSGVCGVQALVAAPTLNSCGASMWDLSPPTRDQAHVPCTGRRILNHWATRKSRKRLDFCHMFFLHLMRWMCVGVWVSFVYWLLIFIYWCTILVLTCWTKLPSPLIFPLSSFSLSIPWLDDPVPDHPVAQPETQESSYTVPFPFLSTSHLLILFLPS